MREKIVDATPTDKCEQLAAQLEYSSILCAKAIKKQQKAILEHRQRRPKVPFVLFDSDTMIDFPL